MKIKRDGGLLTKQEATVLELAEKQGLTQPQIAVKLGLSIHRIRQVLSSAKRRLEDYRKKGEGSLYLLSGRARRFVETFELTDRAEFKAAIDSGTLVWRHRQLYHHNHSTRMVGWKTWCELLVWAGLPKPAGGRTVVCPHCGTLIEV